MGFWMLAGLLSLFIGGALVLAAWRSRDETDAAAAYDLQVYRDQLREIDKDLARGVLTEDEAERTRTEVARRVLEADRALQAQTAEAHAGRPQRIAVLAGVAVVIAGAFGLYQMIGAPGYPDLPIETRISLVEQARAERPSQLEAEAGIPQQTREDPDPRRAELVAELRETMESHPDEPEGLRLRNGLDERPRNADGVAGHDGPLACRWMSAGRTGRDPDRRDRGPRPGGSPPLRHIPAHRLDSPRHAT